LALLIVLFVHRLLELLIHFLLVLVCFVHVLLRIGRSAAVAGILGTMLIFLRVFFVLLFVVPLLASHCLTAFVGLLLEALRTGRFGDESDGVLVAGADVTWLLALAGAVHCFKPVTENVAVLQIQK